MSCLLAPYTSGLAMCAPERTLMEHGYVFLSGLNIWVKDGCDEDQKSRGIHYVI